MKFSKAALAASTAVSRTFLSNAAVPGESFPFLPEAPALAGHRKLQVQGLACPADVGYVDCKDGFVEGDSATSCYAACDNGASCCYGNKACEGFTGRVCKDGSCYGRKACFGAKIGLVLNSCIGPPLDDSEHSGDGACFNMGGWSHYCGTRTDDLPLNVGLSGSCHGHGACWNSLGCTGIVNGNIIDSCHGRQACYGIAIRGTIDGDIRNSCVHGDQHNFFRDDVYRRDAPDEEWRACYLIAGRENPNKSGRENGGYIGGLTNSCNGDHACTTLAQYGRIESGLSNACNGDYSCYELARDNKDDYVGSVISKIQDCCNDDQVREDPITHPGQCLVYQQSPKLRADEMVWTDSDLPDECTAGGTIPAATTSPTASPTSFPTSRPTQAPTLSPTVPGPSYRRLEGGYCSESNDDVTWGTDFPNFAKSVDEAACRAGCDATPSCFAFDHKAGVSCNLRFRSYSIAQLATAPPGFSAPYAGCGDACDPYVVARPGDAYGGREGRTCFVKTSPYRPVQGYCSESNDGVTSGSNLPSLWHTTPKTLAECRAVCDAIPSCDGFDHKPGVSCHPRVRFPFDESTIPPGFLGTGQGCGNTCAPLVAGDGGDPGRTCYIKTRETASPTTTPTASPTPAPTASPTVPGPLTLIYDKLEANFTAGASNELEVGFVVGAGHDVTVNVYETCDKGADEVSSSLFTGDVDATPDPIAGNTTHSNIIVGYNFNKAEMTNSSLWNSTRGTFTFCQVTSLSVPDQAGGNFVILEDKREIEVKFDLDADFKVDVELGNRTVEEETEYINFDKDVEAYKCRGGNGNSFIADAGALPPNTQLAICIRVQNNTSVDIVQLANMVIDQEGLPEPKPFVENGNPKYRFTEMPDASEGVIVKTMLPLGDNGFQFESGLSLNISGTVDLRLAAGRRLRALAGENSVAGEEGEVAEINVVVGLQSTADAFGPIGSSDGHAIVGKGLAAIGLMVLAVTGVVMM